MNVPERVGKEVSHEILDLTAASDLCRMMCSQLGSCVGFTFFDHVGGDRNVAQCCFLRRATRWQPNFRRASCHLARGGLGDRRGRQQRPLQGTAEGLLHHPGQRRTFLVPHNLPDLRHAAARS
ncbi:unnamed protein product [Effrenium voratum]|nr:unnamed protein product [Effrenium voratum]